MEDNMNSVKRVYVEKKQEFAVQAKELKQELKIWEFRRWKMYVC